MKPTWDWLLTVMDATEAQLRFGVSLTRSADPAHPEHPLNSAPSLSGGNFTGLLNSAALSLSLQSNSGRSARSSIATTSNAATNQGSTRLTVGFTGVGEATRNSRERKCTYLLRCWNTKNEYLPWMQVMLTFYTLVYSLKGVNIETLMVYQIIIVLIIFGVSNFHGFYCVGTRCIQFLQILLRIILSSSTNLDYLSQPYATLLIAIYNVLY